MKATILIVDDEPLILSSLHRSLRSEEYDIITSLSGEDALRIMRSKNINVVISDQSMNGIQGIEFLLLAKKYRPQTVRILLTGHADMELAVEAVNKGEVFRFLTKPWDHVELKEAVECALAKSRFDLISM
jgi:DNA-binding NtrC family response regulator